jgi:two-component system sensor histidine kinase KdpD
MQSPPAPKPIALRPLAGLLIWLLSWTLLLGLQTELGLAASALLLVIATLLAALCWPLRLNLPVALLSVLAFNWRFVPPFGTLSVALHEHLLLLLTLAICAALVSAGVARQRRLLEQAQQREQESEALRALMAALRDADDALPPLQAALATLAAPVRLMHQAQRDAPERWLGEPDPHQRSGLQQCALLGQVFGPGSGRHEDERFHYLPLRGAAGRTLGAACLPALPPDRLHLAQALCDQAGLALERMAAQTAAREAAALAREQGLRNTLLAAIAHDHRTPLASIIGSASSLLEQEARLDATQRRRLAARILSEAEQLLRIGDNGLQLARITHGGMALRHDWESAEELVGSLLARLKARDPGRRLKAYVQPGLPLLRCDAVLLLQLLDNLVDNALRHGGDGAVELRAEVLGDGQLLFAVRDRGAGPPVLKTEREALFQPFRRGDAQPGERRGTGLGLALAQAVAEAHGGRLRWLARDGGGSSFECLLPVEAQP